MPEMIDLAKRYESQGLVLIGIHTKDRGDRMAAYAEEAGIDFPIAVDSEGKTVKAFAVDSYPDYYLIDRQGTLRVADLKNADLERAVKILLAEKPPAQKKGDKDEGGKKKDAKRVSKPKAKTSGTD